MGVGVNGVRRDDYFWNAASQALGPGATFLPVCLRGFCVNLCGADFENVCFCVCAHKARLTMAHTHKSKNQRRHELHKLGLVAFVYPAYLWPPTISPVLQQKKRASSGKR